MYIYHKNFILYLQILFLPAILYVGRQRSANIAKKGADMFRLWAKIWKENHLLQDTVIVDSRDDTRTHKVFRALDEVCLRFDLGKPIWLDSTVREFQRHSKARFRQDSFIEQIPFDYLEIQIIEED